MSTSRPAIEYAPGLDGVRGVCLLGVFLYHAQYPWAGGFFFSVSTFFTLSGYLITTLLLAELRLRGAVDLSLFWEKRLRRMGPALWLGVGLTLVTSHLWVDEASREVLGLDGLSAVLFFSNWRFMSPEYAYSKLFADPSALQHCWTLAIEAQYYLVIPVILEVVVRRTERRGLALWVLGLIVASVAAACIAVSGHSATYRGYYGTDVRSAELLVGALMAVMVDARWLRPRTTGPVAATAVGVVGLAGMVFGWAYASVGDLWLYRGGFAIYSLFSAATIFAVVAGDNPIRRLWSNGLLCWVGRLSYGAYIYHWPIFLWLNEERTGLPRDQLFAVRLCITMALAWISYHLVEDPIRRRRWLVQRTRFAAVAAAAFLASVATVLSTNPPKLTWLSPVEAPAGMERSLAFGFFGDSMMMNLGPKLNGWLVGKGMREAVGHAQPGCALVDRGSQFFAGVWADIPERCQNLRQSWTRAAETHRPDVAVVLIGAWDVRDRRLTVVDEARAPGDPVFDRAIEAAARETIEMFRDVGVKTVWLTCPLVRFRRKANEDATVSMAASNPARMRRFDEIVRRVASEYPEDVRIVDFAAYLDNWDGGPLDPLIRPDGVHFGQFGKQKMAYWLGPEILRAAYDLVPAGRGEPMVDAAAGL